MKRATRTARSAVAILAVAALAATAGCRKEGAAAPPRLVVLYATCTLNKGYLSPYAPGVAFTPNLERFRRQAVTFRRHQTESGQSGTAFASIFTGSQADRHGVFRHPARLPDRLDLIGEAFRRGGYEVSAWLEHGMASGELGYGQGADPERIYDRKLAAGEAPLAAVLERLRRDPGAKAFLLTAFTVTHGPYQEVNLDGFCRRYPGECALRDELDGFERYVDFYRRGHAFLSYDFPATRERTAMSDEHLRHLVGVVDLLYRANVSYLDLLFGALVEEIRAAGLWDETLFAFTADHGETLFREGTYFKWTHGHQLAPEVIGVPLLVRGPGIPPGDYDGVTRSIDVLPTLLGLAGLPVPPSEEGRGVDLSPALRGEAPPPKLRAWSHTVTIPPLVLEASEKWGLFRKLNPSVDPELMWVQVRDADRVYQLRRDLAGEVVPAVFDLARDPTELKNLYTGDGEERRVVAELRRYRDRLIRAYHEHVEGGEGVDEERARELLESLGYIDG